MSASVSSSVSLSSPMSMHIPSDQMPAPFVGTPYANAEGVFEYPFPTPPLPTPPYQPHNASPSPSPPVAPRSESAILAKMGQKMVKEGPIPPGLRRRSNSPPGGVRPMTTSPAP
ncbi:hypothetical protein FRB96_006354 [Tulasnella sp. 330]|nr:hypothetical protein FRB96_006354 [Tulasnella sp. 330]KAG8884261.1 hypothetical protein FRB97_004766 [Tulasnella sp. 331]KAG8889410.1 hypothetical protein FRB98_004503 [Tulasnella sp. 332]